MSGPPPRLVLVDGSAYLYRAFHALPPLSAPNGLPTNAVYGFTAMLLRLLAEAKPAFAAVVFDAPGATFRDALYADYKAQRAAMPEELAAQIPWVHRVVDAFRLRVLAVPGVEADDVIASMLHAFAGPDLDCVVVTADKDFMQLVRPGVRLLDTMRDRWLDGAAVEAKLGVPPERVVDVMALMGDSTDNVPGVRGIGEKTAVALVREFGDLDGVLASAGAVERLPLRGARRIAERLRSGAEAARLSRELVTLRCDVPLDCTLADLRVGPPDVAAVRALFGELGFQRLLRQLDDEAPPVSVAAAPLGTAAEVEAYFGNARAGGWAALAVEVDPGPPVTTPARELLVAAADLPPARVRLDDEALRGAAAAALNEPGFEVIGYDLKRDLLRLGAAGIALAGRWFDVKIAGALAEPGTGGTIDSLATELLGSQPAASSGAGAVNLFRPLAERLRERLAARGLEALFAEVEMPLVRVLADIERRGMLLDVKRLRALGAELEVRLAALMNEIHARAGGEFNINSTAQLRAVLFERLGLPARGVRRGKTGLSTDVDVLNRLAAQHPLPAKILEYRNLAKLKSTYVDALPAAVNAMTGRVHTTLHQTGAATGRLSSSDPNLQNIPVRGEEGRRIRDAFVAAPGCVLVAADYSQIELRILAHLSGDPSLLDAFARGQDVHARTASDVFGVLPGVVTADMRRTAKVINFGILYGMGPQRLASELGIGAGEAQRHIANYFERYAGVRRYMERVVEEARERGYTTTILGRQRALPELRSRERAVIQAAERVAVNTPVQGSAADIIKKAMVAVDRRLATAGAVGGMILQVHDELLLEVGEQDSDWVCTAVREEMEGVMALAVRLQVDVGVGRTWAEAH